MTNQEKRAQFAADVLPFVLAELIANGHIKDSVNEIKRALRVVYHDDVDMQDNLRSLMKIEPRREIRGRATGE